MSTPESYLRDIGQLNNSMWAQAQPLEKKVRELDTAYQTLRQGSSLDILGRATAVAFEVQLNDAAKKLNTVYDDWQRNLTLIAPPSGTKPAGNLVSRIPWPNGMPADVRRYLTRAIQQGGVPLSKRVTVKPVTLPFGGGAGVAVEFGKW